MFNQVAHAAAARRLGHMLEGWEPCFCRARCCKHCAIGFPYPTKHLIEPVLFVDAQARHGVSFLDTYAVTRDVLELSFDGAHYGDPASLGLALEVEHWLESALRGEGAP